MFANLQYLSFFLPIVVGANGVIPPNIYQFSSKPTNSLYFSFNSVSNFINLLSNLTFLIEFFVFGVFIIYSPSIFSFEIVL